MNKSSVIILIVAAVVFTGLGFLVGNVMAKGQVPGSADDPVVTQSHVEKIIGTRLSEMQNKIDELEALLAVANGDVITPNNGGTDDPGTSNGNDNPSDATNKTVKVTGDSVNIRASASASAERLTSVSKDTVLTYISQSSATDGTWYKIKTSGGTEGWIRSDFCTSPQ